MKRLVAAMLCLFITLSPALCSAISMGSGEEAQRFEFTAEINFATYSAFVPEGRTITFTGTIDSQQPIRRIYAILYDRRQQKVEKRYEWVCGEEDLYSFDLYDLRKHLLTGIKPGEKSLQINVSGDTGVVTVYDRYLYYAGECVDLANITERCKVESCQAYKAEVRDYVGCVWKRMAEEDYCVVRLPDDGSATGMSIFWEDEPGKGVIRFLNADEEIVSEIDLSKTFSPLHSYYPIGEDVRSVSFIMPVKGPAICDLQVYDGDSEFVQVWEETRDDWDLMVVSTHQDDEHIFFGALLSKYALQTDRTVGIVYMTDCGLDRLSEALDGLWSAGLKNYPSFIGLKDRLSDTLYSSEERWGGPETIVGLLVEQIRRYKPEVIVTHSLGGEYGHTQHISTATRLTEAFTAAADPSLYPESAALYGTWQAQKLYIHYYEDGESVIVFDWNEAMPEFGGMTGYEVSRMCYDKHRSQQDLVDYRLGIRYDNSLFGLYGSMVGPDTQCDDLFENIK